MRSLSRPQKGQAKGTASPGFLFIQKKYDYVFLLCLHPFVSSLELLFYRIILSLRSIFQTEIGIIFCFYSWLFLQNGYNDYQMQVALSRSSLNFLYLPLSSAGL